MSFATVRNMDDLGGGSWLIKLLVELPDDEYDEYDEAFDAAGDESLNQWLERLDLTISNDDRRTLLATIWPRGERPRIAVTNRHLDSLLGEAQVALDKGNEPEPVVYRRGNHLVHIERNEEDQPIVYDVDYGWALARLAEVAEWWKVVRGQPPQPTKPDRDVARTLTTARDWHMPTLRGVVRAPVMRQDGTILQREGYDPATSLFYQRPAGLHVSVPARPTNAEVDAGLGLLNELVHDFPFASHADKVNYLAYLLTPLLRPVVGKDGVTPLALIESPRSASGKGKLAQTAMVLHTGSVVGLSPLPKGNEDEVRKTIFARLLAGATFIVWDNVTRLESEFLKAVLTMPRMTDRILQHSKAADLPNSATWAATGNNVVLDREMTRRTYLIRLVPETDRPDQRTGFLHDPLLDWVAKRRNDLLAALLTMCRAWYVAGRPRWKERVMGSFEEWTQVVGGVLQVAGHGLADDFLANMDELWANIEDEATEAEAEFFASWHAALGDRIVTVAEQLAANIVAPGVHAISPTAAKEQGIRLRDWRDMVAGGFILRRARPGSGATGGQAGWQVKRVG